MLSSLILEVASVLSSRFCSFPFICLLDSFHLVGLSIFDSGHDTLKLSKIGLNLELDGWDDCSSLCKLGLCSLDGALIALLS